MIPFFQIWLETVRWNAGKTFWLKPARRGKETKFRKEIKKQKKRRQQKVQGENGDIWETEQRTWPGAVVIYPMKWLKREIFWGEIDKLSVKEGEVAQTAWKWWQIVVQTVLDGFSVFQTLSSLWVGNLSLLKSSCETFKMLLLPLKIAGGLHWRPAGWLLAGCWQGLLHQVKICSC